MVGRAAQELDLLLQEGQADEHLVVEGLVRLYANEIFRFAWVIFALETESPTVQRLLARRAATRAITTALHQLRRFQEEPGTFLWLLALTFQQFRHKQPTPAPALAALAAHLQTAYHLSPEDIAYILKIPAERAFALVETEPSPPPSPLTYITESNYREHQVPTPLTAEEITILIEQIQTSQIPQTQAGFLPPFFREFAFIGLAVLVFIFFVRATPNNVINLPTPVPTAENTASPSGWDISLQPLQRVQELAVDESSSQFDEIFYQPENPYRIWRSAGSFEVSESPVTALAFSPTEPILATGTSTSVISLWDTGGYIFSQTLPGHTGGIYSLTFSPDGTLLASGGGDGTIRLWDMASGELAHLVDGLPQFINALDFSPDGSILAAGAGNELWFWQVEDDTRIATLEPLASAISSVDYSPDGRWLAVREINGTVWILRVSDGATLLAFETNAPASAVDKVLFSPDGNYLLTTSNEERILAVIQLQEYSDKLEGVIIKTLLRSRDPYDGTRQMVNEFAFSPDGKVLAVAVDNGLIHLIDTATWALLQAPLGPFVSKTPTKALSFSGDGTAIAASQLTEEVFIWQLQDVSAEVAALEAPQLFTRWENDRYRDEYTVLESSDDFNWSSALTFHEASELTGFPVKVPSIELVEGDYQLDGLFFQAKTGIVSFYYGSDSPDTFWGFTILQRQVESGEQRMNEGWLSLWLDVIGRSAVVEPVQIGGIYAELVVGGWMWLAEDNPDLPNFETLKPGDSYSSFARWNVDEGIIRLRWAEGEVLYEISAYYWGEVSSLDTLREELFLLAESMAAPEQAPSWQTILQSYPAEPFRITDLNCDGQEETLLLLRESPDQTPILGLALEITSDNTSQRLWQFHAGEMEAAYISEPELFSMGACEQFIAVTGSEPFTILTIEFADTPHPTTGQCPNKITPYTWNGQGFDKGETKLVSGECLGE